MYLNQDASEQLLKDMAGQTLHLCIQHVVKCCFCNLCGAEAAEFGLHSHQLRSDDKLGESCVVYAENSVRGSVLLAMLFRKSAQQFTEDYYRGVSNAQLQDLHSTFKAYVPDDYQQVCFYAKAALHILSNPSDFTNQNAKHFLSCALWLLLFNV